jgi:FkbM family methyltransferase
LIKALQRTIDRASPSLSVRLRLVRKSLRHDMTLAIVDRLVQPGQQVVDVGAYRGVYTLSLSQRVGSAGRVWAIEPYPPNVAALRRIARHRPNIMLCAGAASDHAGRQILAVPVYRGHRLGALATLGKPAPASEPVEIDVVMVDSLLSEADRALGVDFIRCDVVGHEDAALAGAEATIRGHRPALFVEIEQRHRADPVQTTLDRLLGYGYDGYFVKGPRLVPLAQFDLEKDQLAFLDATFIPYGMPPAYVHYFLFVRPGTDLRELV